MKKSAGFTLLEMMIVLIMAGILLTMAVPTFTDAIKNNRQAGLANDLIASLHSARTEAIKRSVNVTLCRSTDGANCSNASDWEEGWLVYADADNDNTPDAAEILQVRTALNDDRTLTADANYTNGITFNPRGFVNSAGGFVLCDERGFSQSGGELIARAVVVSATGRPRIEHPDHGDTDVAGYTNCNAT